MNVTPTTEASSSSLRPSLSCPLCHGYGGVLLPTSGLETQPLRCRRCGERLPLPGGVPNLALHLPLSDQKLPFKQRVMNSKLFARLYERGPWRPFHAYVASHGTLEEEVETVLGLAQQPGTLALDVACGTGLYARAMARRSPSTTVLGLDISPGMLQYARTLQAREGLKNLYFVRADIHRLPLPTASVDHINCCAALHLFSDLPAIWRELARVLRPGGTLTGMTVFHRPLGKHSFQAFLQRHLQFTFFEPDALAQALRVSGLDHFQMRQQHAALMFSAVREAFLSVE